MTSRGNQRLAAMLTGQVTRIAVLGGYFVLLARQLGATEFGAAAAVIALVALLVPFSNLGAALLLIKNVARDHTTAPVQWANTTSLTLLSGGAFTALATLVGPWVTHTATPVVVASVGISDLVCLRLVDSATSMYTALDRIGRSGFLQGLVQLGRLASLTAAAILTGQVHLTTWALSYVAGSIPVALGIWITASRHVGYARPRLSLYAAEWKTGLLFSIGMSSQTIYNDIDKTLLARLSTLHATGIYAAAYRIIDMSYVPMRALIAANARDMYRAGADGVRPVLDIVRRRLVKPAAAYCITGTVGMILGAQLLPLILGPSFSESVTALRLLAPLLLLKGAHYIAADTLTCGGAQRARTVAQVGIAALNVVLCLTLIPAFGWQGAVAASLVSDGLLAVSLWTILWTIVRRPEHQPVPLPR